MNKKLGILMLIGAISAQTFSPAVTAFAEDVERTGRGGQIHSIQTARITEENSSDVNIPDANLKAELNKKLGQEDGAAISVKQLQGLEKLELHGKGIKDITGLQHCTNLRLLQLGDNQISDITPLTNLTNLTSLEIQANKISNITPLAKMIKLTSLNAFKNEISDLQPLSGLTNLQSLYLHYNKISDITPLKNLGKLILLRLNDNQISNIDVLKDKKRLRDLYLNNNQITDIRIISIVNFPEIKNINLKDQEINGESVVTDEDYATVSIGTRRTDGRIARPVPSLEYTYDFNRGDITFKNVTSSGEKTYKFSEKVSLSYGGASTEYTGTVKHKITKKEDIKPITAELDEKEGIKLSTVGEGLRFFVDLKEVDVTENAKYYITTEENEDKSKFEIQATVENKSRIKVNMSFEELEKLEEGIATKLYVKRIVGDNVTYIELKTGNEGLEDSFINMSSDSKVTIKVSTTNNIIQLTKSSELKYSFDQGVSKIYWNDGGLAVSGIATFKGLSEAFKGAKVSILVKDSNGDLTEVDIETNLEDLEGGKDQGDEGIKEEPGNGEKVETLEYKFIIPYEELEKLNIDSLNEFEFRVIGENIQIFEKLKTGTVQDLKEGLKDNRVYELLSSENVLKLKVKEIKLQEISSELTSILITGKPKQFSIQGTIFIPEVEKIDSSIKYNIILEKDGKEVFEKEISRVADTNGSYNKFKTNLSLAELIRLRLNVNEKVTLKLESVYLGNVITTDIESKITQDSIKEDSIKDENNQTPIQRRVPFNALIDV